MINVVNVEYADNFFSLLPEHEQWSKLKNEDKEKYIRAAVMSFAGLNFRQNYFKEDADVPDRLKWAICYQALYLSLDENRIETDILAKRGIKSSELKLDRITDKITYQGSVSATGTKALYPMAYNLIKPYLILSADIW